MAKGISPDDATRSDHRFIVYLLKTFMKKKKVLHDPKEFERVTSVFAKAGGSWERLFKGSARDINLLRRVVRVAVEKGVISKAPQLG